MKWLLIYVVLGRDGPSGDTLEFESRELCERRGIGLLQFASGVKLKTRAICRNAETGEEFEVKLPPRTAA